MKNEQYTDKIDIEYSKEVMRELSAIVDNPLIGNRSAASDAEHRAADYLYNEFKRIGLENVTKDPCPVDRWQFSKGVLRFKDNAGSVISAPLGGYATDCICADQEIVVAYAGKGTEDDFQGKDVSGKFVLIEIDQMHDWWINFPAYEAHLHGAAGVICINVGGFGQTDGDTLVSEDICGPAAITVFSISRHNGFLLRQRCLDNAKGIYDAVLDADSRVQKDQTTYNIWGEIPGSGPGAILVINHYDAYYRTVFDDVQGIGWALGMAKAFIDAGCRPHKTIRIIAHGAEEWSLSNNKHDWALGAYKQIRHIRPEWAAEGFAVVNLDGFYACKGEKHYAIPCTRELYGFIEDCVAPFRLSSPYQLEVNTLLTSSTEDFSYSLAGIPGFVAGAYDGCVADKTVLHSSASTFAAGFDDQAFYLFHRLFGAIIQRLDEVPVRPLDLGKRFDHILATVPREYPQLGLFREAADKAREMTAAIREINDKLTYPEMTAELTAGAAAVNDDLFNIFRSLQNELLKFDWNDQMIVPHERYFSNIVCITEALDKLAHDQPEAAAEDLGGVDYNYYARWFSEATYDYFVDQVIHDKGDTWGTGLIEGNNEDFYAVIRQLKSGRLSPADKQAIADALETARQRQRELGNRSLDKESESVKSFLKDEKTGKDIRKLNEQIGK